MRNKLITGIAALMLGAGVTGCAVDRSDKVFSVMHIPPATDSAQRTSVYSGRSITELKNNRDVLPEIAVPDCGRVQVLRNTDRNEILYFLTDRGLVLVGEYAESERKGIKNLRFGKYDEQIIEYIRFGFHSVQAPNGNTLTLTPEAQAEYADLFEKISDFRVSEEVQEYFRNRPHE